MGDVGGVGRLGWIKGWRGHQRRQIEIISSLGLYPHSLRPSPPVPSSSNRFLSFALILLRLLRPCQRFYPLSYTPLIYLQLRSNSCPASSPSPSPSLTSVRYLIDMLQGEKCADPDTQAPTMSSSTGSEKVHTVRLRLRCTNRPGRRSPSRRSCPSNTRSFACVPCESLSC